MYQLAHHGRTSWPEFRVHAIVRCSEIPTTLKPELGGLVL
jgi:hypothetical protein